ncbi:hypothetical protein LTR28_003812 [Elasticomyces elasticus]|nr:hypothetical protein LTR28_003812 [Elasticomyces elasticus]
MQFFVSQSLACLTLLRVAFSSPIASVGPRAVVVDDASKLNPSYDYVVIGGGASGLVVANRLTENSAVTVLVIEYGYVDAQDGGTSVPGLLVPSKYRRDYTSVPQPGLDGRTSPIYTGAVVGGGTVVNGMFFNRGSAGDYDAWEKLGNPGWGWSDLLPYFKKSETFTPPIEAIADEFPGIISTDLFPHGTNGPVGSSFSNYQYPIIRNFFKGWNSIGIKTQPQPNAGDANGAFYGPISLTAKNQSRSDASDAYYRPIAGKRANFHLITGQTVSKINFSSKKKATSVNVLQLSGIGPKELLSGLGIKTIVDLPGVGRNFQDQVSMFPQWTYSNYPFPSPDWATSNQTWADEQLAIYYKNRTAFIPLQNVTSDYQSIIKSASVVDPTTLFPADIDPTIIAGYKAQSAQILSLYASAHATVEEVAWAGGDTVSLALLKPLSRGVITINTTDPTAVPVFDYGTFTHPTDIDVAVQSFKKLREFMSSGPMLETGAVETYPGANVTTDAQIAAAIRGFATSTWAHPTCSCAMMPLKLGGVVDSQLRVYGVTGLRIVDASIMPMIPGSHTASTVYAVAEKAADIIKSVASGRK